MPVKKELKFTIELDDNNHPIAIEWEATDGGEGPRKVSSIMVHMWDKEVKNSLSIDLWTRDMLLDHMNIHVFHQLMKTADSYARATGNQEGAAKMREFAKDFAIQAKAYRDSKPSRG